MLTDAAARKRKPNPDKRVEIHDGHGLYLVIQSSGAKSWAYRYRVGGKSRKLTLGNFSAIEIEEARALASAASVHVKRGGDPAVERRYANAADDSFEVVARQFIKRYSRPKKKSWGQKGRWVGFAPGGGGELIPT